MYLPSFIPAMSIQIYLLRKRNIATAHMYFLLAIYSNIWSFNIPAYFDSPMKSAIRAENSIKFQQNKWNSRTNLRLIPCFVNLKQPITSALAISHLPLTEYATATIIKMYQNNRTESQRSAHSRPHDLHLISTGSCRKNMKTVSLVSL